jgi:hypothetical protein
MSNEQMREICKAHFYGHTVEEIASLENVEVEDVIGAISDGKSEGVFQELQERKQQLEEGVE